MTNFIDIAKEIIEKRFYAVGVRSLCEDEQYSIGDYCRESYEWDIEEDCSTYYTTGETANGTCATHIDNQYFTTNDEVIELAERIAQVVKENQDNYGGQQIIIAGNQINRDGLFDSDEIRIANAIVIGIV